MLFQRYTSNYPKICHRTANYTVKLHYQMLAASVTAVSAKRNEISRCILFYGKDKLNVLFNKLVVTSIKSFSNK